MMVDVLQECNCFLGVEWCGQMFWLEYGLFIESVDFLNVFNEYMYFGFMFFFWDLDYFSVVLICGWSFKMFNLVVWGVIVMLF